jgi:hypothetical protein
MANILYPPSRPQSVGEILDSGFRIFGATLAKCWPYAAGAMLIGQLPAIYAVTTHRAALEKALLFDPRDRLGWLLLAVAIVGAVTLTNALILRQYELVSGKPLAGSALGIGARRVGGMLLIGLLVALAACACALPIGLAAGAVAGLLSGLSAPLIGATVVIVALLPASWLFVRWMYAGWGYLLTERGAIESLRYSWRLTRGSFWRLTVILSVALVLLLVVYLLSFVITGVTSVLFGYRDVAVVTAAGTVVVILVRVVVSPFYTALALATYGDLAVRKEGADLAQRIADAG